MCIYAIIRYQQILNVLVINIPVLYILDVFIASTQFMKTYNWYKTYFVW